MTVRARALLMALMLTLWAVEASTVFAHGVLERSDPPANTTQDAPPAQIRLWFTEPVDPEFSTITVLDATGHPHGGPLSASPDGRGVSVTPGALPRGIYTVRWRVLSASDGHITSGVFLFGIGQVLPAGVPAAVSESPQPLRVIVRWGSLLSTLLLAGVTLFRITILRPTLVRLRPDDAGRLAAAVARSLRTVAAAAAVAVLLLTATEFLTQAATLFDAPLARLATDGRALTLIGSTKAGWSALTRATMAGVVLLLSFRRRAGSDWVEAIAGAVLLGGLTLGAHAAGRGIVALAADWIHLLAVAIWIGGLAGLLVALRAARPAGRTMLARAMVPRFSMAAAAGLAAVTLTGAVGVWLHVPEMRALITTPYGRALLAKALLVALLVALGAWNRFAVRPGLKRPGDAPVGALRRFIPAAVGEVAIAAAVVFIVAVLTLTPPAGPARSGAAQPPVLLAGMAGDLTMRLTLASRDPGWNRLDATVTDSFGRPVTGGARVLVRLLKLDEDLDPITMTLVDRGDERHTTEGPALGLPGLWQLDVIVRRAGRLDVVTSFPLRLGLRSAAGVDVDAARLFDQVRNAVASVRTWRETQQLTDGSGSAYLTWLEAVRPDRQHFKTSSGVEVVALGEIRYQRTGSDPWRRYTFSRATVVEGPLYYMRDARAIRLGRAILCEAEPCRVLLWTAPDGGAEFAAWVGLRSHLMHTLLMLEPTHHMTLRFSDFNAKIRIEKPTLP